MKHNVEAKSLIKECRQNTELNLSNRESLYTIFPWARALIHGQMAAPIRGRFTTVYHMGQEPTNVPKTACFTAGSGIRARDMERYDLPLILSFFRNLVVSF